MNGKFYSVAGLGYDKNGNITDFENDYGNYKTMKEALFAWQKIVYHTIAAGSKAFVSVKGIPYPRVAYWHIQLELCEEDEFGNTVCIDVIKETDVYCPKTAISDEEHEKRKVVTVIEVDDTIAEQMDAGPIDMLDIVLSGVEGVELKDAKVLDDDDPEDWDDIARVEEIFN